MKVGVTGTRNGMTPSQVKVFLLLLSELDPAEFHHGDCIGVDETAAGIVHRRCGATIIRHPPEKTELRAYAPFHEDRAPKNYFARNRDIVNESELLIVVPSHMTWHSSGGTWMTHDYARKRGKLVRIIWPDGSVTDKYATPPVSGTVAQ